MMIRTRISRTDDNEIYSLIQRRLVPIARKGRPLVNIRRRTILKRLQASMVFVVSQSYSPKPYGFISFQVRDDVLMIDMLAVNERVQNKGYGSRLIKAAEDYARRRGARLARLAVDGPNQHAQYFYMKQGYYVANYIPDQQLFVMEKEI